MFLPRKTLEQKLQAILAEDTGQGDITTSLIVPVKCNAEAKVIAKEPGIAAGIEEAKILLDSLGLMLKASIADGEKIKPKQDLMIISGDARAILSVERTLLNLLSRMSGIATVTRKFVDMIHEARLKTRVACTRKTAPGLLYFDKKAVSIGGGDTHRLHLDDMVLIKDNHIALAKNVEDAINRAKEHVSFSKKIEVEVTNIEDALTAAKANVDVIMLDNFSPEQIRKTVRLLKKLGLPRKILLEASGGITAGNIITFASTGVDIVSLGEITASARSLDISMEITRVKKT